MIDKELIDFMAWFDTEFQEYRFCSELKVESGVSDIRITRLGNAKWLTGTVVLTILEKVRELTLLSFVEINKEGKLEIQITN